MYPLILYSMNTSRVITASLIMICKNFEIGPYCHTFLYTVHSYMCTYESDIHKDFGYKMTLLYLHVYHLILSFINRL